MRLNSLALFGLTAVLSLAGCIERPVSATQKRQSFSRDGLDVLLRELPTPQQKVGAIYGDAAELVGVDLNPQTAKAGQKVEVTFYFKVLDETDDDWKVFVHVDDRSGRAERINADHWPASGKYPTSMWRRGEVVKDVWTFKIPDYYQGDGYDLWTGFYQPGKDDRWPLTNRNDVRNDGQNRVAAASVLVR